MNPADDISVVAEEADPAIAAAHDAAARICTLIWTGQTLIQAIEARTMEAVYDLRRALPDREEFSRFVSAHTPLQPQQAWLMADTWHATRKSQPIRTLVDDHPGQAMRLVQSFINELGAAGASELVGQDREVAQIIAAPLRKRTAAIRALLNAARAPDEQRPTLDSHRIETLIDRQHIGQHLDAAREAPTDDGEDSVASLVADLLSIESRISALSERVQAAAGGMSDAAAERVLRVCDMAGSGIEQIQDAVSQRSSV